MKICIDARFLTHPQMGGFKTYSKNLVRALAQVDSVNEYIIYIDRPPVNESLVQQGNFTYRIVKGYIPGFKTAVREQFQLRRAIGRDKPDVVHFLCNTAPVNIHEPFILTLHDTIQAKVVNPFPLTLKLGQYKPNAILAYSKWTIDQTARKAKKIITVSNYEKNKIAEQLAIDREDILVTHLAPDPIFKPASQETKAEWRQELSCDPALPERFILGIGHEPRKNISLLIEAFAHIAPGRPDLSLVIVAAQDQARLNFQHLANDLELNNRVVVLGGQSPAMLAKLYNLAELFVYPSERESFGLPPLEAIACNAPTIAMNMSSLPEILQDGVLFVDGKETQKWADALESVLKNEKFRLELICRGQARAADLNWQTCAQKTIEVYDAAMREYYAVSVN